MDNLVVTSIKLPRDIENLIAQVAKETKISRSKFMRDAIIEKLEDMLDNILINKVMRKKEKSLSLKEAKHALGLDA